MAQLKHKVVRGFAWNIAEKIASALFQIYVTYKVANRLFPEDYALVAIMAALVASFNTMVDSGFSQALIRKKEPTAQDFSSAFWFNIAMSAAIYGALIGISYPVARWLEMPRLVALAPVLYLVVPLGALAIIQQTVLTRAFDFRRLSLITFTSMVGSGVVAIVLAINNFGVWALVAQRVVQIALRGTLLWIFGRWAPALKFSARSIKEMFGYSSRLLATDLLNNVYNSVPQFIIGHIHHGTLGRFDMARKLRDVPVNATMNSAQAVVFPALAAIRDDDKKFAAGVGQVVSAIVFLMFPMMAGLIAVADELFAIFLKPEWEGAVPFFRILCLAGMVAPLSIVSSNILRTRTSGKAVVRAEIFKKINATIILAATIPFGAIPITWGVVGIAFSDAAVSFAIARRHSDYGFGRLARDIMPILALTLVMAGAVWGIGFLLAGLPVWAALTIKIFAGISIYLAGAALFVNQKFKRMRELLTSGVFFGRD